MAHAPLQITEIIERSAQGLTKPFLCRCEDGKLYYVKGHGAGRRSLLCEWLAGHLARAFGLPVPPFEVVQAPPSLARLHPEGGDLGSEPAFGSCKVEHTQDLTISHIDNVSTQMRRDVLVFDWWIRNADRTLTTHSGNPNVLWGADDKGLVVIDHNTAFDPAFNARSFSETHVFAAEIPSIFQDLVEQMRYSDRLRRALATWSEACQNVPDEWWFADAERTVPANFDPEAELALLKRCTEQTFWNLAT